MKFILVVAVVGLIILPSKALKLAGTNRFDSVMRELKMTNTESPALETVANSVQRSDGLLNTVFAFKPFFSVAKGIARKSIVSRGAKIGVSWDDEVGRLQTNMDMLTTEYNRVRDPRIEYPSYYTKPFHAYDEGNLCWDAAMEVECAALSVHCHIYTGSPKILEREGDFKLRDNFHTEMRKMLAEKHFKPKKILDVGCSTGLSTAKLHDSFPDAEIIGIDLSPYMLAGNKVLAVSKSL